MQIESLNISIETLIFFILSIISIVLSISFWFLARNQANEARKTLDKIDTTMHTWQKDLNKTSLDILQSRPEIIGKQVALEEAKAQNEVLLNISKTIEEIALNPKTDQQGALQIKILELLLDHTKKKPPIILSQETHNNIAESKKSIDTENKKNKN